MNGHVLLLRVAVGLLSTVMMDLGGGLGLLLGVPGRGPQRMGHGLIGRWVGYLFRGKFHHADILETPPLRGELIFGILIHYLIGVILALFYFLFLGITHLPTSALIAIAYGLATTVFPWFLMFPSEGMGWLGRDAPGNAHLARASLFNHAFFGFGLALWTALLRPF
jgi:hypothetical protein